MDVHLPFVANPTSTLRRAKSLFCPHWMPYHKSRNEEQALIAWQPAFHKHVNQFGYLPWVYDNLPNTTLILRDVALSHQYDDMYNRPEETGRRHAREWNDKFQANGWPKQRTLVEGTNEPLVGGDEGMPPDEWEELAQWRIDKVVRYNVALGQAAHDYDFGVSYFNLGTGWPNNTGADTPAYWAPYERILEVYDPDLDVIGLHGYWGRSGPRDWWTWWAGRHEMCPWPNVRIFIGECGMDLGVEGQHGRSWQGAGLNVEQYWQQWLEYHELLQRDARVDGASGFTIDFNKDWHEFDLRPMIWKFANYEAPRQPAPQPTPQPVPDPQEPEPQPDGKFERAVEFVLRWEGGYVHNPADPGGETKYGISKRSYPYLDIKNLTREQAIEIYRRDYWDAAGAGELRWPLALVYFDAAVNHGVGAALYFLGKTDNPVEFVARRIEDIYTTERNAELFRTFGRGWMRRMAALLGEIATWMDTG